LILEITGPGIQSQVAALVAQFGEPVTLDRGGATRTVQALFEPANAAVIGTYFDDNAAVGLIRPCVQALFDGTTGGTNDPPQGGDTFTRDGRTFTVQRVQNHRLGGTVVLITALCD